MLDFRAGSTARYSPESQSNNRRVEVEATATLVEDLQDKSAAKEEMETPVAKSE